MIRTLDDLNIEYDALQNEFGSGKLNSVYGCGCIKSPKIVLVFMNPTGRNIATDKNWTGLRAQWLGTKPIWDFLTKAELFSPSLNAKIRSKRPQDWTPQFCHEVYSEVSRRGLFITNLAKCSQDDARSLPDSVFLKYKDLLFKELLIVNPAKIFLFGNQVSSVVLGEKISVSSCRGKRFDLKIEGKTFETYALYYPVGNGSFNQLKTLEDVKKILS